MLYPHVHLSFIVNQNIMKEDGHKVVQKGLINPSHEALKSG
jgi:hypothetical protein